MNRFSGRRENQKEKQIGRPEKGLLRPFHQDLKHIRCGFSAWPGAEKGDGFSARRTVIARSLHFHRIFVCGFFECGNSWPQQICPGPLHLVFHFQPLISGKSRSPAGKHQKRCGSEAPPKKASRPLRQALLLLNEEQIQAPKNASIARFDGLGCYRISSETGGGPVRRLQAGSCTLAARRAGFNARQNNPFPAPVSW